jgi:hypothetical protein
MMIAAILPHQRAGACRVQDRRQLLRGQERLVHDAIDVTSIGLETSQLRENSYASHLQKATQFILCGEEMMPRITKRERER